MKYVKRLRQTVQERLDLKLERRTNGCLEWTGVKSAFGYGRIGVNYKTVYAHRLAWSLANDQPVPEGECILHTCDNPPCCEPTHLWLGTYAQNNADRSAKGRGGNQKKTHCPQNHPLDKSNTYVKPNGKRECLTCKRTHERANYHRKRSAS